MHTLALLPPALNTVAPLIADMLAVVGFLLKLPYWLIRGLLTSPQAARHRWALGLSSVGSWIATSRAVALTSIEHGLSVSSVAAKGP